MKPVKRPPLTASSLHWNAWFDGATAPNPGARGIGGLLIAPGGEHAPSGERIEISAAIGYGTNNEAEYEALLAVLREAVARGIGEIVIHGDSLLVINQVTKAWACKSATLGALCASAQALVRQLERTGQVSLRWIPREQNQAADALSCAAIGLSRETADEKAAWTNQQDIGRALGLSAIAVGRNLEALGFRENKVPTPFAIEAGLARITEDHFGKHIAWHKARVLEVLTDA
jgi:ribonuclease HI